MENYGAVNFNFDTSRLVSLFKNPFSKWKPLTCLPTITEKKAGTSKGIYPSKNQKLKEVLSILPREFREFALDINTSLWLTLSLVCNSKSELTFGEIWCLEELQRGYW